MAALTPADGPSLPEPWLLHADDVLRATESGHDGISEQEAGRRLQVYGPNELPRGRGVGAARIIVRQFTSPLIYILLAAAVVALAFGETIDAAVIAAALVVNAVLGFYQEYRAERSMEALHELTAAQARVVRDGREHDVDAREVVPGDVLLLEAGERVPADARLVRSAGVEADESLLTGESVPVAKSIETLGGNVPVAERANMVFTGSVLTRGRCRVVVTATGESSELGATAERLGKIGEVATPLQRRMSRFAHVISIAIGIVAVSGFAAGLVHGKSVHAVFLAVIALAVAAIPEGLPIVLTVALAISVQRMAASRAVVRRLPAVESLGSCTVIGSDKTGTLTQNRMTVLRIAAGGHRYAVTAGVRPFDGAVTLDGTPVDPAGRPALKWTLLAGTLCNEATVAEHDAGPDATGDPAEVALLVAAAKSGMHKSDLEERYPRWAEIPFMPERRYAATFHEEDGREFVVVKGSPERVLAMCSRAADGEADREFHPGPVLREAEVMAADGLRVLAMAGREIEHRPRAADLEDPLDELTFFGLQGMIDPPREEAREAVAGCVRAGIRVLMISGDHASTALAVAGQLGIARTGDQVVTGANLDGFSDRDLDEVVKRAPVYARAAPEHKLRIVEVLRRRGEVVAVTGDGVNDAAALKAADIGAAMGTGTDVAKQASDIVVLDDSFATIFRAVREGRVAFDNVRKTTFFLVSSGVATVLAVLTTLAAGLPLPLLPAQLLWLNLVTNGVQDVALAFEPGERGVAERPPRPPREGVISGLLWERTVIAGVVMAAGTLAMFLFYPYDGGLREARTAALTTMVVFQVVHVGNSRSEHQSAFAKSPFSNPLLFAGTAAALALHIGAMHLEPTQVVLRLQPLDLDTWLVICAISLTVTVAVELHKLLRGPERPRRRGRLGGALCAG